MAVYKVNESKKVVTEEVNGPQDYTVVQVPIDVAIPV